MARELQELAVRFKAEGDTGWYETTFRAPAGTVFQAALPKPRPQAARVTYYITTGEPRQRSPEYLVPVLVGGCPGARSAPPTLTDGFESGALRTNWTVFQAGRA